MRKLLLAAALLASTAASAQITLERKYAQVAITKLANGDTKYYSTNEATRVVTVYNDNHSVLRTFTVPAMSGYQFIGINHLTDQLFNQDNALEYIGYYAKPATGGDIYKIAVNTESGTQLMQADSTSDGFFYRAGGGVKMMAYTEKRNAAGQTTGGYQRIWALGGSYVPTAVRAGNAAADALPYPNPATGRITLPYQVQRGQQATLEVLDMTGRIVKRYTVDGAFDHLALQTGELPTGTYTYRVNGEAGASAGKKFVVSR